MNALVLMTLLAPAAEPAPFAGLREAVCPATGEDRWDEVRWGTDIWEARVRAAKLGKPIFLWEMDGHPLGCT
ncbi:MAG: hypothetical protein ACRC33_26515 [Gemmataceae bacterium]